MTKASKAITLLLALFILIANSGYHHANQPARSSTPPTEEKEAVYTGGIKVNLTEEEVQEAINWGAENKDSPVVFRRPYNFGSPNAFEESGRISTKFYSLADCGYGTARKYKSPEKWMIDIILGYRTLTIYIFTYGDRLDFAKNYHMVIKQGEKIIQPVSVKAPELAKMTARWPHSPSYKAIVSGLFAYSEINPKGKAVIILIKGRGESKFEVDFSRYK